MVQISVSLLSEIKSFIEAKFTCNDLENQRVHILSQIDDLLLSSPSLGEAFYRKPGTPPAITHQFENATLTSDSINSFLKFGHWIGSLKTVKRTGWLIEGLSSGQAESVAEHSYRMAMLLFALPQLELGKEIFSLDKAIKMCLVHDAAEAIVGDIPPTANVPKDVKFDQENDAMLFLDSVISKNDVRSEFYKTWDRYEKRDCIESKIVKDLDRIELLLQTYEYKLTHPNINCEQFFERTLPHFEIPFIKQCAETLNERWRQIGPPDGK